VVIGLKIGLFTVDGSVLMKMRLFNRGWEHCYENTCIYRNIC